MARRRTEITSRRASNAESLGALHSSVTEYAFCRKALPNPGRCAMIDPVSRFGLRRKAAHLLGWTIAPDDKSISPRAIPKLTRFKFGMFVNSLHLRIFAELRSTIHAEPVLTLAVDQEVWRPARPRL